MHRKRLSSSSSSTSSNNGLVMLYEAAMLIEQQNIRVPKATFPPTSLATRSLVTIGRSRPSLPILSAQTGAQIGSGATAFRVPSARVRLEPTGHGGYQVVANGIGTIQQHQQQQLQLVAVHNGSPGGVQGVNKRATASFANPSVNSRSSHNELEKNRRAHLRQCLDMLRDQLPLSQSEATRLTMLSVLTKSHGYLKDLQALDSRQKQRLVSQQRRQRELLHRREQLKRNLRALRKRLSGQQGSAQQAGKNRKSQQHQALTLSVSGRKAVVSDAAAAVSAAQQRQWRCRNVSEISAASISSEDITSASSSAAVAAAQASVTEARSGSCGTPDSGYASPPNAATTMAAAAHRG